MTPTARPACAEATAVAAAVSAVPGVAGLSDGAYGEIALLYPGARVAGLRWADGRLEVHVAAAFGSADARSLYDVSADARAAATSVLGGVAPIDVHIDDVVGPTTATREGKA